MVNRIIKWMNNSSLVAWLILLVTIGSFIYYIYYTENQPNDVVFLSNPTAGEILVDGRIVGKTPLKTILESGKHEIKLRKHGFGEIDRTIHVSGRGPLKKHEFIFIPNPVGNELYDEMETKIATATNSLNVLKNQIEKLQIDKNGAIALVKDMDSLRSSFTKLKSSIIDSPEKSVSLPLIKKDIEVLREKDIDILSRINDMISTFKWFIGIQITILTLIGGFVAYRNSNSNK